MLVGALVPAENRTEGPNSLRRRSAGASRELHASRDAMPNGGTLVIEVRNTVFSAEEVREYEGLQPGEYAVVFISDTGQGIALGLSMVCGFVKQSGGLDDGRQHHNDRAQG
jgi:hypothetical protein